ncbi:hypothetical protein [Microcoleus sp. MON2_D5]|uniref:hypothetical protein n=1 Tax=Microcoleus sp. MON2_D5 TaxID=2818833 RepID=UPI002FD10BA4
MRWLRLHQVCLWVIGTIGSSSTLSLSRKHCLTLEMIRKLDRELYLQKIGRIHRYQRSRTHATS